MRRETSLPHHRLRIRSRLHDLPLSPHLQLLQGRPRHCWAGSTGRQEFLGVGAAGWRTAVSSQTSAVSRAAGGTVTASKMHYAIRNCTGTSRTTTAVSGLMHVLFYCVMPPVSALLSAWNDDSEVPVEGHKAAKGDIRTKQEFAGQGTTGFLLQPLSRPENSDNGHVERPTCPLRLALVRCDEGDGSSDEDREGAGTEPGRGAALNTAVSRFRTR